MATLKAAQERLHARTSARIERLKKRFFSDKLVVDTTRAKIVTRVYQETEGEPIEIRRAKTLERILQEIPLRILPDELIVGCQNASSPRSANVFPEMATYWLERELDELSTRPQDKFYVSDEAKAELRSLFPYWKGRTLHDHMVANMPKDTLEQLELEHPSVFGWCAYQNGVGHIVENHEMVIRKGYRRILEEAEQARQELDLTKFESIRKDIFSRAVTIVCNAVINFGRRYAAEARRCAQLEKDETRKSELLKIEEICTRVPEHPASSFHEAVQFLWFIELVTQLEVNGVSISPGRFDQYMYPYLEKDLPGRHPDGRGSAGHHRVLLDQAERNGDPLRQDHGELHHQLRHGGAHHPRRSEGRRQRRHEPPLLPVPAGADGCRAFPAEYLGPLPQGL